MSKKDNVRTVTISGKHQLSILVRTDNKVSDTGIDPILFNNLDELLQWMNVSLYCCLLELAFILLVSVVFA